MVRGLVSSTKYAMFIHMRKCRLRHTLAFALVLLALASCGKQEVPPDEVYSKFYAALIRAGRGDPAAFQSAAKHLSRASIEELSKRAEAVNQTLDADSPKVDPRQMLSIASLESDAMPSDIEVKPLALGEVELKVTLGDQIHRVHMVQEGKEWKVDLFDIPHKNNGENETPDRASANE